MLPPFRPSGEELGTHPVPPRNRAASLPDWRRSGPVGSTEAITQSSRCRRGHGAPAQHFPFRLEGQEMLPDAAEMSSSGAARDPPCGAGEAHNAMETVGWALQPQGPAVPRGDGHPGRPFRAPGAQWLTHPQVVPSRWASGTDSQGGTAPGRKPRRAGTRLWPLRPPGGGGRGRIPDTGRQTAPPSSQAQPLCPGPL